MGRTRATVWSRLCLLVALLLVALLLLAPVARAQVRIVPGPTPIPGGDARVAGDLTVINDRLAFALAVESAPPYGVPRAALIDLAPVSQGRIGHDTVIFADFIPNNWSAWPNRQHALTIVTDTPQEAVVETVRDWGMVTITTRYSLKAGDDQVHIVVTMANGGPVALPGLRSGLTLWPGAGHLLAVPGLADVADGPAAAALSDRVVAYDEGWAVALHAPYVNHVGFGSRDMYRVHTLAPGETRRFEGWLQVVPAGDLAPVVAQEIARKGLASAVLSGRVTGADGRPVAQPVVMIEKAGTPYAWTIGDAQGRYRIELPRADYAAYATARGHTQTPPVPVGMTGGGDRTQDFAGLQPPGTLNLRVVRRGSGRPLDARITIERGQQPQIGFLGRRVFFTDLDRRGKASLTLAPGDYDLAVSWGKDVLAPATPVHATIVSGQTTAQTATIDAIFDPASRGWVSADLHHHADQAEAVTPAPDLARSQLAAGLDLLFVSDHDSVANLAPLRAIARRRGVPFLPGIEITTSWAHFNAWPLRPDARLTIDTAKTTVGAIFAEARRMGAAVIQVNHPFIPYGYFTSVAGGVAPGGFNPAFDVLEINARNPEDDDRVVKAGAAFWNAGQRHYLAAGTDVHDVWSEASGRVRTFVHPGAAQRGVPAALAYARALKAGHAYVTYGPLVFPDRMFGDTMTVRTGRRFALGFTVQAVRGLKRATLLGRDGPVAVRDLASSGQSARIDFPLTADGAAWYMLIVEDSAGARAFTNPVWIAVTGRAAR